MMSLVLLVLHQRSSASDFVALGFGDSDVFGALEPTQEGQGITSLLGVVDDISALYFDAKRDDVNL